MRKRDEVFTLFKKGLKKDLCYTKLFALKSHPFAILVAEKLQKADCVVCLASQSKIQQAKR